MNSYEKLYNLLTETRSAKSRFITRARKEKGETRRRKKAGKSMDAWRQGSAAGVSLGKAKASRRAATSIETHSIKFPGDNPKERAKVTATAANALRKRAARKEKLASAQIKTGKRSASNKRIVNRSLKRDETMGNLKKLSIRDKK